MPLVSSTKPITKNDRRKQWKDLKSKHSKAIAKAKVNFDQKLGPALDTYQTQVDKLNKLSVGAELVMAQVKPVVDATKALKPIIESYHDKVQTLEEPARHDMTAFLAALNADRNSWAQVAAKTTATPAQAPNNAQIHAAIETSTALTHVRNMTLTTVAHGQRAKADYEKAKPKPRKEAAGWVGSLVNAANLIGPAAHEVSLLAAGAAGGMKYELFKQRAKALEGGLRHYRDASQTFATRWSMNFDVNTISNNADAMALHDENENVLNVCTEALEHIVKLP